jgi:cytosine/adenosine deaminase-related metal-dependent hydrolase
MAWLKFSADNIFDGAEMLENKVLVTNGQGVIETIIDKQEAGEDVQYFSGILSPGFINCHCHLELSHMKGLIPEQTGLVDFVMTVMSRRNFEQEQILDAITKAEKEMMANGIVAVGDICNTTNTIQQKQQNNLHYYNFIEATGFVPQFANARFEQTKNVYDQFSLQLSAFDFQYAIVPHAPYSTSLALMQLINEEATGKTISIHNQESKEEDAFFITGESKFRKLFETFNIDISFYKPSGKSSLQTYLPTLNKAKNLLLVHDSFTSIGDIHFIQQTNQSIFVCLCPNANIYIENVLPNIDSFINNNLNIVVGTDSLASNHQLNIREELKTIRKQYPSISITQLLQWATSNGAKALQMNDMLGSFEKGKQPGIVLIDASFSTSKRIK